MQNSKLKDFLLRLSCAHISHMHKPLLTHTRSNSLHENHLDLFLLNSNDLVPIFPPTLLLLSLLFFFFIIISNLLRMNGSDYSSTHQPFIYLFFILSIHLLIPPFIQPLIVLSIYLFMPPCIPQSSNLSIHASTHLCIHSSINLSLHPSTHSQASTTEARSDIRSTTK